MARGGKYPLAAHRATVRLGAKDIRRLIQLMMIVNKLMASSDMVWTERNKCDVRWELLMASTGMTREENVELVGSLYMPVSVDKLYRDLMFAAL